MIDVLPQAREAEEQILGAMLMSNVAAEKAASELTADCFFHESHASMFEVMREMLDSGQPTDPVMVDAVMKERGISSEVGGRVKLAELMALTPATANVGHYIKIVRDAWRKRLVLAEITRIQNEIETMSADEAVGALELAVMEIEQKAQDKHELVYDIKDLIEAKRWQMEHPEATKPGVPSPFSFLPDLAGGRLYVLSGYMKDGKSRAAIQFAEAAARAGEKVGFASAEMSRQDLFDAWACQKTGLPHWKISKPWNLEPREQTRLHEVMEEMKDWKVQVIDDERIDPAKLRRYQRAGKYDLLVIDHLHRMSWRDRHHLDEGVKSITNIAREFEIPVILLAQMNRSSDISNPYPAPTMNRLKESSTIEAEASAVWFVYRHRDEHNLQTSRAQFIVAANRYGKVGVEEMYFDDASQSFQESIYEPVVVTA